MRLKGKSCCEKFTWRRETADPWEEFLLKFRDDCLRVLEKRDYNVLGRLTKILKSLGKSCYKVLIGLAQDPGKISYKALGRVLGKWLQKWPSGKEIAEPWEKCLQSFGENASDLEKRSCKALGRVTTEP